MSALMLPGLVLTPSSAKNNFALLAVSWQPAFCEKRSDRPECAGQTASRYDANNFSLHGLWPGSRNSSYCNIPPHLVKLDKSGRWGKLADLRLEPSLASRLNQKMPGTRSYLHRHEWIKHGSCHENGSANGYFKDSLRLLDELNNSSVRRLFAKNIGKKLTAIKIQQEFDKAFGRDAGKRIKIKCWRDGDRRLIGEITIGLYGEFDESTNLAELIQAARPTKPNCNGGIVDHAGLQ